MWTFRLVAILPVKKNRKGTWSSAPLAICTDFVTCEHEECWHEEAKRIITLRKGSIMDSLMEIRQKRNVGDRTEPDSLFYRIEVMAEPKEILSGEVDLL